MCAAEEFKFLPLSSKFVAFRFKMTANVQGSNILDVLKKKMRATKEECEKYREDCEDLHRKLQAEIARREEVRERGFWRGFEPGFLPESRNEVNPCPETIKPHPFFNDFQLPCKSKQGYRRNNI